MSNRVLPVLRPILGLLLAGVMTGVPAGPLAAQQAGKAKPPLSAIDWLSKSVQDTPAAPGPPASLPPANTTQPANTQPAAGMDQGLAPPLVASPSTSAIDNREDSVTDRVINRVFDKATGKDASGDMAGNSSGITTGNIKVTPIGAIRKDSVGLLPASVTGLPQDFWGDSDVKTIVGLIDRQPTDGLPEVQSLLYTILLAEVDAPKSSTKGAQLLLARTDKLLDMGALEQAQALLERAGPSQPEIFRRWFDVSLLTGHEDHACTAMRAAPAIAPTLEAQVFCLARGGDWNAAAVTLATGETLGFIPKADADLMTRFLDPGMFEGAPDLPVPKPLTPLDFVMREAIGQPRPSGALPLAFLNADMQPNGPWRAQLQAAERLVRSQALTPNRLIELYTERKPAASGGIWDRAAAIQAFDVALLSGDAAQVEKTLTPAYDAMQSVALAVPFSLHYGARLAAIKLTGTAAKTAFKVALLSKGYEVEARKLVARTPKQAFLVGLALGQIDGLSPPGTIGAAIADAFLKPMPKGRLYELLQQGKLGEAILRAMLLLKDGAVTDPGDIRTALATFRAVGLESVARRIAIQLLLLKRRG